MGKTYIIPEINGEWVIENDVVKSLNLAEYIDAMRNSDIFYVTYNGTEYSGTFEKQTEDQITGYVMSFNPPELDVLQGAQVVFVPSLEMFNLQVGNTGTSAFPPGFKTNFTFSMYVKDGSDDEQKDEDTTGRAPSKNLTVTDFKSSQNMAFRLERVIKHLDPTAKIVDRTLWKLMDILEGIVFSSESSPEQGVVDDGGGASY